MERLTEWNDEQPRHAYYPRCFEEPCYGRGCKIEDCPFETAVCERLAAYEDTGLTPEQCENAKVIIESAFSDDTSKAERIRELLKADKDGLVLILPCKLGTKVYRIRYKIVDYPDKPEPEITTTWFTPEYREDIGKTVFLSREEAERALQEMEGKE